MEKRGKETKILCTIGPSSNDSKTLQRMHNSGMNAVRINTAHGDFSSYQSVVGKVRKIGDIPIVLDIKGPDLRVKTKENIDVYKGEIVHVGLREKLDLNYNICNKIKKGDKVLIDDGRYSFKVVGVYPDHFEMKAKEHAIIHPNKNANVPEKSLHLPQLSHKDIEAIDFAKKNKIEFIALSFTRNIEDIKNLRRRLNGTQIKIIAKIENHEGLENINEIIDHADGIMVARGDLGVELPAEEVPIIQKQIIKVCNQKGKLVIVATQMLESMVERSNPTRAETSDVANAVLDGADCLMLSEETTIGKYPVEAVKAMSRIATAVEPEVKINIDNTTSDNSSEVISCSVYELVKSLSIDKIVCLTYSGYTATKISRFRLDTPIYAITSSDIVKRQLMLSYSIKPIAYKANFWDHPIIKVAKYLYKKKMIHKGENILFTAGLHIKKGKKTNTIQVHKVDDIIEFFS